MLLDEITKDPDILKAYQTDFGNFQNKKPSVVARPTTLSALQDSFQFAHTHGYSIAFRGGGQSFSGQSMCENGMVIDVTALRLEQPETTIEQRSVRSMAGVKLHDIQTLLRQHGQRLPVYTSAIEATLGGTLAAGGISGRSFRRGLLASHVQQLTLMATDGEVWECSRDENRDVFSLSLANMGLNGVLLSAKLTTEPLLPFRVQLILKGFPIDLLVPLVTEFKTQPDIITMEGFITPDIENITADVYCTIEAGEESEIEGKKALWKNLVKKIGLPGYAIRVVHINDPLNFSESLEGWATGKTHNLQAAMLNKRSTVYAMPVPTAFNQRQAISFLTEFCDYVSANRYYFMTRPYFAVIDAMQEESNPWLCLSNQDSHVIALDLFVTFPFVKRKQGLRILNGLAAMAADHNGRLYPYGFIPSKEILERLVPKLTRDMRNTLEKTNPGGLIKPILYP